MQKAIITPYLAFDDCAAAMCFYRQAFGAVETGERYTDADGRIGHAAIEVGAAILFVSDEYRDYGARSPKSLGGSHVALHVEVDDADAAARQFVAAGGKTLRELAPQSDGERRGTFLDPFGYRWMIDERIDGEAQS